MRIIAGTFLYLDVPTISNIFITNTTRVFIFLSHNS